MRLSFKSLLSACVFCALATCSAPLRAQQAPSASNFDRGLRALQTGDNVTAADAFEAAYAEGHPRLALLNLGIAYTNLGRIRDALNALEGYVRAADPTRDARNIAAVRAEIERLRALPPTAAAPRSPVAAPGSQASPAPVPPAAQPARAPAPTRQESAPPSEAPACALGNVCIGPVLDLGLPNAIGGGFHVRLGDYFGVGADFQVLPSLTVDVASASASLFSLAARLHPFGGSFFLSGGFAYQSVYGRVDNGEIAAEAHVGMPALLLGIGFFGHDGLVLGIDLALVFPLAGTEIDVRDLAGAPDGSTVTQEAIDQARADAKQGVKDILDALPVLVQLNLVRIGFLF